MFIRLSFRSRSVSFCDIWMILLLRDCCWDLFLVVVVVAWFCDVFVCISRVGVICVVVVVKFMLQRWHMFLVRDFWCFRCVALISLVWKFWLFFENMLRVFFCTWSCRQVLDVVHMIALCSAACAACILLLASILSILWCLFLLLVTTLQVHPAVTRLTVYRRLEVFAA